MQPEQIQKSKYKTILLAVALVGVIAITVGLLVWAHPRNPGRLAPVYIYKNYDDYTLKNSSGNISFKKPASLQVSVTSDNRQFEMWHTYPALNPKNLQLKPYLTFISGYNVLSPIGLSPADLSLLNTYFKFPDTKYYPGMIKPLKQYLADRLPNGWTLTLNRPKQFTNKNIANTAWLFTYTATDPTHNHEQVQGDLVYAINDKNYYYFTINAGDRTWVANQTAWKTVLDSLKLQ